MLDILEGLDLTQKEFDKISSAITQPKLTLSFLVTPKELDLEEAIAVGRHTVNLYLEHKSLELGTYSMSSNRVDDGWIFNFIRHLEDE